MCRLAAADTLLEPKALEAVAVVDAVNHSGQPVQSRPPADRRLIVEQDGTRVVFDQLPFNLPHQFLALIDIDLRRLLVDQLVDLGIAVAGVVAQRAGIIVLIKRTSGSSTAVSVMFIAIW